MLFCKQVWHRLFSIMSSEAKNQRKQKKKKKSEMELTNSVFRAAFLWTQMKQDK